MIALDSVIAAGREQVSCDLNEEAVILNLQSGVYYGLDRMGARIWNLLQSPRTVGEIRDLLLQEFDVEPARCEADLLALFSRLQDEGLIEVRG
jgi:hypothetical protein